MLVDVLRKVGGVDVVAQIREKSYIPIMLGVLPVFVLDYLCDPIVNQEILDSNSGWMTTERIKKLRWESQPFFLFVLPVWRQDSDICGKNLNFAIDLVSEPSQRCDGGIKRECRESRLQYPLL